MKLDLTVPDHSRPHRRLVTHLAAVKKDIVPVDLRNVRYVSPSGPGAVIAVGFKATELVLQGLAFPDRPIFAPWRPNNENEVLIAIEALLWQPQSDRRKVSVPQGTGN